MAYAQGPGEEGPALSGPFKAFSTDLNATKPFQSRPAVGDSERLLNVPTEGQITAVIWLEGDPAAKRSAAYTNPNSAAANNAARQQALALRAAQGGFRAELAAKFAIETIGQTTYLSNTLIVSMDASQIDEVKKLPGVRDVFPDQIGYLDNSNSVPFIGVPTAWSSLGLTGQGIRIGIIDSGIDYTHANFGGSGNPAVYAGNDTSTVGDNIGGDAVGFDNSKVVGGYDFVGDGWGGGGLLGTGDTPRVPGGWLGPANPFGVGDNDPQDCNGHGSHVAGTAAGFGVDGGGATYAGPYPPADFSALTIGPGVAPEAELFALKIGDCSSAVSFAAALLALEMVMDPNGDGDMSDRLDVTNSSYGGAYGTPSEILVQAFDIASANDVVMVASAGNEGDVYFVNGDPGIAASAISVASSVNDTLYAGLQLDAGDASYPSYPTVIPANPSQGGALGTYGSFQLRPVLATLGGNSQGCSVADYAGFAGEAGLIVWDATASGCGSGTRMTNAVNAGNVSGLVVVTANGDFPFINLACTYNGGPSPIPCVSVTQGDGANLAANPSAFSVTFDSSLTAALGFSIADQLSGFSSRGPSTTGGLDIIRLKPDVAAPGDSITSTGAGTGTGAATLGGTSMASPHVTGMVALLRQQHPTWSVAQIKALVMNTATHDLWTDPGQTGDNYGVSRVGAGRVDMANAINSGVVAYNTINPEQVSVSYGLVEVVDTVSMSRTITVQNLGSTTETYDISFQQMNDVNGASFSVSPASVTVGGGSSQQITVTLTTDKSLMSEPHLPDPTTPLVQSGAFGSLPRHWFGEEGGYVVLSATSNSANLRVPVHAVVRPASAMAADGPLELPVIDAPGEVLLPLAGNEVWTGNNFPFDVISQVSAFELVYENPNPVGDFTDSARLKYIGVTSDYPAAFALCAGDPACAIDNTVIYIGVVTHEEWSQASGFDTWFDIGFDVNEDGFYDRTVFNFETGYFVGADWTDTIMTWLTNGSSWLVGTGSIIGASDFINGVHALALDTYVMNNNVLVFPVWATDLGLSATNTDFQFDMLTLKNFWYADLLPTTDPFWFSYDVVAPTYSFSDVAGQVGGPYLGPTMWNDLDGNAIPVDYDVTAYGEGPFPPILLLHHHNGGLGNRAELVDVVLAGTVQDPTDSEGQAGEAGGAAAGTETGDVTTLPSTGYPPSKDEPRSSGQTLLILVAAALALVMATGGVLLSRKSHT